jgi:hypothetical protein
MGSILEPLRAVFMVSRTLPFIGTEKCHPRNVTGVLAYGRTWLLTTTSVPDGTSIVTGVMKAAIPLSRKLAARVKRNPRTRAHLTEAGMCLCLVLLRVWAISR